MSNKKLELSRRKMLAGFGAAGVAAAGAGLGTTAFLSDEESFQDNAVQAGTLDLEVTAEVAAHVDNDYWNGLGLEPTGSEDEAAVAIDVDDVKPGDWAILGFTVDVNSNPAYVTIHAKNFSQGGGPNPEPEQDTEGDANNDANLDEKLLVSYWEQLNGSSRSDLQALDNITNAASDQRMQSFTYGTPDEDGVVQSNVEYTNLREFYFGENGDATSVPNDNDPLGAGFASGHGILVGGSTNPVEVGATDNLGRPRLSDPDGDGESELVFYLLLEIPPTVGNEIQGDSASFDLVFNSKQVRNVPASDARSGVWQGYV